LDWNAAGAIGEILGAIAVFLTLAYLAAQIRQANKMARFETTREIMAQFNACNQLYATDPSIRRVLCEEGVLSDEDGEQLYSYVDMYCNAWATAQMAFSEGLIDETLFRGVVKDVAVALRRWPNMRQPVERWFDNYPDFKGSKIFKAIGRL